MKVRAILIGLVIVGLLASGYVAVQRARVESRNRAVELVVDYGEIAQITAATGKPDYEVLKSLKESGVTSVAVAEETVRNLMDDGIVSRAPTSSSADTILRVQGGSGNIDTVFHGLLRVLGGGGAKPLVMVFPRTKGSDIDLGRYLPTQYVEQLPVGVPQEPVTEALKNGLGIIARLVNYPGSTPAAIDSIMADVKKQGISTVIFQGDQVLGFKGAVDDTAKAFEKHGLLFGRVEFAKQKGEQELAEKSPGSVIPVHSISQNEMPTLSESAIAERFQKAVRERGVRICYVRMYDTASADLLRANCDYIRKIAGGIRAAGYELKSAHAMGEVSVPAWVRMLVAVGVAAGAMLLVLMVVELPVGAAVVWTLAALVVCIGLSAAGDMGRKLVAFGSALVFPTLAGLWAVRGTPESPVAAQRPLLRAWGRMLGAIGISVVGGMLIVGLLSSRGFMLRIDQFMGIKAAHLLPILALAALFAGGIAWSSGSWADQKKRLCDAYRQLASNPILIWQAVGLLAVMIVLALVVARSGNDAGLQVSSVELKFRAILDKVLFVRPRTKEFLIGYPLLLAGLAFLMRGRRQWGTILVVVGSIGLVSALNTFCHIHTPLSVTALRVVNGVVVGSVFGLVFWRVIGGAAGREGK